MATLVRITNLYPASDFDASEFPKKIKIKKTKKGYKVEEYALYDNDAELDMDEDLAYETGEFGHVVDLFTPFFVKMEVIEQEVGIDHFHFNTLIGD